MNIAAMALVVSFLSSGFAVYQWWTSGRDEKIRATIEISNKFNEDAIDPKPLGQSYAVALEEFRSGSKEFTEIAGLEAPNRIRKHFERLEYISYLANRGKLEPDYMSQFVKCDIVHAPADMDYLRSLPLSEDPKDEKGALELPTLIETTKFAEQLNLVCPISGKTTNSNSIKNNK